MSRARRHRQADQQGAICLRRMSLLLAQNKRDLMSALRPLCAAKPT
jgi:hypothetical protein